MDENKELICKKLAEVVRLTRAGSGIATMNYKRYTDCEEEVIIYYDNDYIKKVNVSMLKRSLKMKLIILDL